MSINNLVILDFETTGLRPDQGDRITEVAALRLRNGQIVERFESLVNCEQRLSNSIRTFTGITQKMIDTAPRSVAVIGQLLTFIGDDPVVTHNAAFDQGFLDSECERLGLQRSGQDFICTVQIARRLLPNAGSHSLEGLLRHFKLTRSGLHRAGADAESTVKLLLQLIGLIRNQVTSQPVTPELLRLLANAPVANWPLNKPQHVALSA